ncbi:MAG TPA: siroheme synthase CysG [Beijerinckiaceae bacterium]|jgi:uroporphyrin-III C-methyltransferase/precorrin-2 dehydrogenase/sirohydrochlorin ferrochelatase
MSRHVLPVETRPARLKPLARLPLFLDLAGKRAVVAGGGEAAAWKAELLAAAGARVAVLAPSPEPELLAVAEASGGTITLLRREWRGEDLDEAAVAVAECGDEGEAARFAAAARARRILVNVIDRPGTCDFQFGTIVNRSPVVIGISTDGAAPILGQAIRRRIEAVLPASLGAFGEAAKGFRARLRGVLPHRSQRRRFWEKFVDVTFISQGEEDARLEAVERLARETLAEKPDGGGGEVVIVGAGPGDPELLTLRAMRELQAADAIVYDRLVTPEVLELARREARRIAVGKEGHGPACRQDDINALILDLARAGNRVVRLKGGDPAIFGRAGEEIEACRAAGIPVAVVPGVTAATAAAASLALSLTHREVARRVQFVTGHDRDGRLPDDLDLPALADPKATTCVYMARRTAAVLAGRLVERGLDADTPALAVANVSRRDEEALRTTLGEIARGLRLPGDGPLVLIVGAALAKADLPLADGSDEPAHALHTLAA